MEPIRWKNAFLQETGKEKSAEGLGGETTAAEPPAGAGHGGLHTEGPPRPLEFHRNVWSKPILRQEGRSRTTAEGLGAGRRGEPIRGLGEPAGHGVTGETLLLHAGFGSPKQSCL